MALSAHNPYPTRRTNGDVMFDVLGSVKNLQVRKTVVGLVAVLVVDHLGRPERSSQQSGHHNAMFGLPPARCLDAHIPLVQMGGADWNVSHE